MNFLQIINIKYSILNTIQKWIVVLTLQINWCNLKQRAEKVPERLQRQTKLQNLKLLINQEERNCNRGHQIQHNILWTVKDDYKHSNKNSVSCLTSNLVQIMAVSKITTNMYFRKLKLVHKMSSWGSSTWIQLQKLDRGQISRKVPSSWVSMMF